MNRKDFLKNLGLLTTGVAASTAGLVPFSRVKAANLLQTRPKIIGLQVYSVRQLLSKDVPGTLKGLAECGYLALEGFGYNRETGYFNTPLNEFDKMVKDLGMKITSSHLSARYTPETKNDALDWWKEIADSHKAIGCNTMVIPSLPSQRGAPMDVSYLDNLCTYINEVNVIAKERGMRLGFHNHAADERPLENGKIILDYLIENTDPAFFIQLDNHNMMTTGRDPIAFLNQYKTRIKVLHVKDDDIIGASGRVDFKQLFETAAQYNIYEPIVEIEKYPVDPMECMCRSFTFLNEASYVQYYG
jgi:sugar phosphate isomerase/epimerase